jgi:hypothetical protein
MENINELANELKSSLDKLISMNNKFISQLPIEHREKILPIQMDVNSILEHVKNGENDKINEIAKKYGSSNNK